MFYLIVILILTFGLPVLAGLAVYEILMAAAELKAGKKVRRRIREYFRGREWMLSMTARKKLF